jgi:hypothetical protein
VRSRADSPCPRTAEVEILGVAFAFCGACAREQEAYFAIGELTELEDARDLRSGPLVEALERMRRDRAGSTDLSLDANTVILA